MFTEDLSVFFNVTEFAVTAQWGAQSASVLFDAPTDDILGGQAIANQFYVTMPAGTFAGIVRNDAIIINSTTYSVREVRLIEDGSIKRITLSV